MLSGLLFRLIIINSIHLLIRAVFYKIEIGVNEWSIHKKSALECCCNIWLYLSKCNLSILDQWPHSYCNYQKSSRSDLSAQRWDWAFLVSNAVRIVFEDTNIYCITIQMNSFWSKKRDFIYFMSIQFTTYAYELSRFFFISVPEPRLQ